MIDMFGVVTINIPTISKAAITFHGAIGYFLLSGILALTIFLSACKIRDQLKLNDALTRKQNG